MGIKDWEEQELFCTADKMSPTFRELWNGHCPAVFPLVKLGCWAFMLGCWTSLLPPAITGKRMSRVTQPSADEMGTRGDGGWG